MVASTCSEPERGGTVALVVAAGRGARFGAGRPKQYLPLGGRPLLWHSLAAFARHPRVDRVRAVINPEDEALFAAASEGLAVLAPVAGGQSRRESVRLGLESLAELAPARVLIHDGARPFVPAEVVGRILAALDQAPGAIAALAMTDTVKRESDGCVAETVARAGLWRAQTPQGFRYADILAAHREAPAHLELTDDAAVAERAGLAVRLVEGSAVNLKVTTPADLERAERWLVGAEEVRTGAGFDVHRFAPPQGARSVRLCGVDVPHDRALQGHSDADVGLHALTDALLGALGAGDIGTHFPPSEAKWRGADSALFVAHARDLAARQGARVVNVDVTLICERPRVGAHRAAMVARVAELLEIDAARVSVKATTTEGLGFTGRGEGIAAQATATLALARRAG